MLASAPVPALTTVAIAPIIVISSVKISSFPSTFVNCSTINYKNIINHKLILLISNYLRIPSIITKLKGCHLLIRILLLLALLLLLLVLILTLVLALVLLLLRGHLLLPFPSISSSSIFLRDFSFFLFS